MAFSVWNLFCLDHRQRCFLNVSFPPSLPFPSFFPSFWKGNSKGESRRGVIDEGMCLNSSWKESVCVYTLCVVKTGHREIHETTGKGGRLVLLLFLFLFLFMFFFSRRKRSLRATDWQKDAWQRRVSCPSFTHTEKEDLSNNTICEEYSSSRVKISLLFSCKEDQKRVREMYVDLNRRWKRLLSLSLLDVV